MKRWSKLLRKVRVGKGILSLGLAFALLVVQGGWQVAQAKEPATPELSLNRAIELALTQSESVKKAEKEVDRTEEWRNYRSDQLDYTPTEPPGNALVEVAWAQLLSADLSWRMSKKSLTAEQDKVALDTCKKYFDVLATQDKVQSAEAALDSARKQLQVARALYNVGMGTQAALTAAEAQYQAAQATLNAAQNDLDKGYVLLNQLVGLWPEDRPVLTDKVDFKALEITNLDYEVEKVLESCPTVWLAQETVTMKKYLEDMTLYTGEYRPYQARKIEVEQAELDALTTKEMFERITRSLYYGVKNLEESYSGAQEAVRAAQENLKVVKAKYEVGLATSAEVAAAEKSLAEAQYTAYNLACQHAYMKLAFEKPWAYLSSLSSN
ncbi:TolC family protein [Syntrophothermus lipocalidus]|uniref:Outer membrane efflux protein n=1 Tax=Syntrophothermus lipocalidus (strain DSM 12680 / TGB-C1) TaxID=643648 RepID=D7CPT2_SYNLT|nr:TolC family protein [Syntrophothermus lipocalidus]ADI02710.1 outer membrane efflux protein [Syntrophothermus lipocalidus DSM 12680]